MRAIGPFSGKTVRTTLIGVGGLLIAMFALLWFVIWPNSTTSAGNQKESGIAAAYESGANALSSCINQTDAAAQGALANAAAFQRIVLEAVSHTGAAQNYQLNNQDGSPNATAQRGVYALFVQAYPNAAGVTTMFHQAVDIITACQGKYEDAQNAVLDRVRDFDRWRTGSWMSRQFWRVQANDNLILPIPGTREIYTGTAALNIARVPIVNSVAKAAYGSGVYNAPNPFESSSPSPAPSASATG